MPTVTDEYGRKREVSMEEFLLALAMANPDDIRIQEEMVDPITGKRTVLRSIPLTGEKETHQKSTSYTPSYREPSKEERERWRREEEEKRKQKAEKEQTIRDRAPEELKKIRQKTREKYGCVKQEQYIQGLEKSLKAQEPRLKKENETLQAEAEALEKAWGGYGNKQQAKPLPPIRKQEQELLEEKNRLLEKLNALGFFKFSDKKWIRLRLGQIDGAIAQRLDEIKDKKGKNLIRLQDLSYSLAEARSTLSRMNSEAEKSLKWREKAIHVFMEEYPEQWEKYERYLEPVLEIMEKKGRATINEIMDAHPRKDELYTQKLLSFFRMESFKKFYRKDMEKGKAYFSIHLSD